MRRDFQLLEHHNGERAEAYALSGRRIYEQEMANRRGKRVKVFGYVPTSRSRGSSVTYSLRRLILFIHGG